MLLIFASLAGLASAVLAAGWLAFVIAHRFGLPERLQPSHKVMMFIGIPLCFALPLFSIITGAAAMLWVRRLGEVFHPLSPEGGRRSLSWDCVWVPWPWSPQA